MGILKGTKNASETRENKGMHFLVWGATLGVFQLLKQVTGAPVRVVPPKHVWVLRQVVFGCRCYCSAGSGGATAI